MRRVTELTFVNLTNILIPYRLFTVSPCAPEPSRVGMEIQSVVHGEFRIRSALDLREFRLSVFLIDSYAGKHLQIGCNTCIGSLKSFMPLPTGCALILRDPCPSEEGSFESCTACLCGSRGLLPERTAALQPAMSLLPTPAQCVCQTPLREFLDHRNGIAPIAATGTPMGY